jgi:hypothetical protein
MHPLPSRRALLFVLCATLCSAPARAGGPASAYYADDADGVFWFMHISDIHVGGHDSIGEWSAYDPDNVIWALHDAVEVIQPIFVVATGDLVNGSRNNIPTAGQDQGEWDDYKAIYTAAVAAHPAIPYYDIIGNHDAYAPRVPDECPSLHWYLDNSYRGQLEGASHFSWTHSTPLGTYAFYGYNSTGDCVNAFTGGDGVVLDAEYEAIKAALEANTSAQLQFVFAHQGPAQPQDSGRVVDELVKHGAFFVHGHVHEYKEYLAGNNLGQIVVNEVNTIGKGDNDNIGVGVVDHNAFTYRATSTADPWPFVVITAPVSTTLRNSSSLNPWAYDVCKDRMNPVRALVFASEPPTSVKVQVAANVPVDMTQESTNLWTAMIDTQGLSEGQQAINVTVVASGKTRTETVSPTFVAGPCASPQQDAGVPQQDAGGEDDGGAAGDDGGVQDDGGPAPPPPADGCGCRLPGSAPTTGAAGLLALAGLALMGRGRGRRGGR